MIKKELQEYHLLDHLYSSIIESIKSEIDCVFKAF